MESEALGLARHREWLAWVNYIQAVQLADIWLASLDREVPPWER